MGEDEYVRRVNEYAVRTSELQGCSPEFWDLVNSAGITYIYLNQDKGSLQPTNMQNCPYLELVYKENGVHIYKILDQNLSE